MPRPAATPWATLARCSARRHVAPTPSIRHINITATSASSEPALEQQVSVSPSAAPALSPGMCNGQFASRKTNSIRCALRSRRLALLHAFRLPRRLPTALYPPRNPRGPQRQLRKHSFNAFLSRTFQTRARGHPLLVPKDLLHQPGHSPHIDQIAHIVHSHRPPRRKTRLDHITTASIAGMDRPDAIVEAAVQRKTGPRALGQHLHNRPRTISTCRQRPDLPGAAQTWGVLRRPSKQCGRLHRLRYPAASLPLQVLEPPLPGPRPRLRLPSSERQVLQSDERNSDVEDVVKHLSHAQDVVAAVHMG